MISDRSRKFIAISLQERTLGTVSSCVYSLDLPFEQFDRIACIPLYFPLGDDRRQHIVSPNHIKGTFQHDRVRFVRDIRTNHLIRHWLGPRVLPILVEMVCHGTSRSVSSKVRPEMIAISRTYCRNCSASSLAQRPMVEKDILDISEDTDKTPGMETCHAGGVQSEPHGFATCPCNPLQLYQLVRRPCSTEVHALCRP